MVFPETNSYEIGAVYGRCITNKLDRESVNRVAIRHNMYTILKDYIHYSNIQIPVTGAMFR